ncbi:NAD(P)H-dependent oxidoreductase [Sphingobium sp. H33]|uniref:NAD(P)H-dependent oxidoreductase n=1 Tax=Sphingobium nicotianae TaxID=2782607 RepID=A0A9X1DAS6_9SPHN|nr:NAD(P)H-dependent oxidoreductase [Sphingobium nicotianae]
MGRFNGFVTEAIDNTGPVLVIAGSARADGTTMLIVRRLQGLLGERADVIDLAEWRIEPFRYGGSLDRDDFRAIARAMAARRHTIFVTPVYWYAMSGIMKIFFDRFTDLLRQPEGRALAGGTLSCVVTGTDPTPPPGFEEPFARTAAFFAMDWGGKTYVMSDRGKPLDETALAPLAGLAGRI